MLLSLRDRYCVALRPDGVALLRRRRGTPAVDLKGFIACAPAEEGPAWGPAVETLKRFAARPETSPGDLWVVLSNNFVRFQLLPWNGELASAEEMQNFAVAAFENVYGETAAAWEVRVSPEKAGAPRIASAVDRALPDALKEAVSGTNLRLVSAQPYLMTAFNALTKPFRSRDFIFLLVEPGRAGLLAAVDQQWRSVRTVGMEDGAEAMAALIEREIHLSQLDDNVPAILVHAPHRTGLLINPVGGVAPRVLELKAAPGFSPVADTQYAMAAAV